jgi:hypothetical protein
MTEKARTLMRNGSQKKAIYMMLLCISTMGQLNNNGQSCKQHNNNNGTVYLMYEFQH